MRQHVEQCQNSAEQSFDNCFLLILPGDSRNRYGLSRPAVDGFSICQLAFNYMGNNENQAYRDTEIVVESLAKFSHGLREFLMREKLNLTENTAISYNKPGKGKNSVQK